MPSTDNIQINTRERPYSTDINNLQSMLGRTLLDLMQYSQSLRVLTQPVEASGRNVIAGGLVASPSGNDVSIGAGALLQYSATIVPTPGPLDSTYRIGINRAAETVVMPAPGVTTYYLIEAQMVNVTATTESRDILDPGTGQFVPTLVPKQIQREVQFQLLTGGANAPAPTGGDWVPIAIVRRPGGGGAVASSDIIDVRRIADFGVQKPATPAMINNMLDTLNYPANEVAINVEYNGPQGLRGAVTTTATDVTAAAIVSPSVVLAASTKFYLYLAPWSTLSLSPRQYGTNLQYEGVLVLSGVAPTAAGTNSALITLPAPFGVTDAPTGSAYLIGTLLRNALNTDWAPMTRVGVETRVSTGLSFGTLLNPPVNGANAVTFTAPPATAKQILLQINWDGNAAGAGSIALTTAGGLYAQVPDNIEATITVLVGHDGTGGLTLTCGAAPDAATDAYVTCCGWRE